MVSSPSTFQSSPSWRTPVERKVRVGKASTSRKSGDFTCASRSSLPVVKLAASRLTSTELSATSSAIDDRAGELLEAALDLREAEVTDLEAGRAVDRVDVVAAGVGNGGAGGGAGEVCSWRGSPWVACVRCTKDCCCDNNIAEDHCACNIFFVSCDPWPAPPDRLDVYDDPRVEAFGMLIEAHNELFNATSRTLARPRWPAACPGSAS